MRHLNKNGHYQNAGNLGSCILIPSKLYSIDEHQSLSAVCRTDPSDQRFWDAQIALMTRCERAAIPELSQARGCVLVEQSKENRS